jgi:hypothetical protein
MAIPCWSQPCTIIEWYSLRPILLFDNTDVSTTKMCLDTSILAKSIMGGESTSFGLYLSRGFLQSNTEYCNVSCMIGTVETGRRRMGEVL